MSSLRVQKTDGTEATFNDDRYLRHRAEVDSNDRLVVFADHLESYPDYYDNSLGDEVVYKMRVTSSEEVAMYRSHLWDSYRRQD